MASNDYHVVVYQILEYLYTCLRDGAIPDIEALEKFRESKGLNKRYWRYILLHLLEDDFIEGAIAVPIAGEDFPSIKYSRRFAITPKGIGYLAENSLMTKLRTMAEQGMVSTITSFASHLAGL